MHPVWTKLPLLGRNVVAFTSEMVTRQFGMRIEKHYMRNAGAEYEMNPSAATSCTIQILRVILEVPEPI